jgi:membrane associated rhomboid family serine protease
MLFKRLKSAVPSIIALNLVVYFFWTRCDLTEDSFMVRNFLISWNGLAEGRVWTLISSVFSHNMLWHLLINMFVLWSFGSIIETVLGTRFFLKFYCFAGVVSSLGHAAVSNWVIRSPELPALGASGAIAGLVLLFALLFPKQKILLLGLIPVPALFGALGLVALDLWGLTAQARGGGLPIGHGAHLGGALAGALTYFIVLRPQLKNRL